MAEAIKIAVLAGTTRAQRQSIHAARLVAEVGRGIEGVDIQFVDPADFTFAGDGNDPEGKIRATPKLLNGQTLSSS